MVGNGPGFSGVSALAAVWMDPGELRSIWAYALLDFYILHGTAIMFLLRSQQETTAPFRLLVHGADIVWAGCDFVVYGPARAIHSPSFFVFVMLPPHTAGPLGKR